MVKETCIGNTDDPNCSAPVVWIRKTQFAGDHYFCDAHARAEKDFSENSSTTVWFQIDRIDLNSFEHSVDKPFSVKEYMDRARAAGHDAVGVANDPEAVALIEAAKNAPISLAAAAKARELVNMPVNHHTRAPNQPSSATIVEGTVDHLDSITYAVTLTRKAAGKVEFRLEIDGRVFGLMPFDNLVKAATRVDPDHAVGTERQIRLLREETAKAKAEMYDWQAKAMQLEEKLLAYQESMKA